MSAALLAAGGLSFGLLANAGAAEEHTERPADVKAAADPMTVAPYLYNGWGDPPDPSTVSEATGVEWYTLAFVLSNGTCDPQWDGSRPLSGGVDEQTVETVRSGGGDVIPSFGGWSGNKLETSCSSADELAGAYQKVIDAYDLKAIDIDIEAEAYDDPEVQQRTVDALLAVQSDNPELKVHVTFGTGQSGPDTSLIQRAADSGLTVDAWTIMPFNFGGGGQNMGELTIQAAEGLKSSLVDIYGYDESEAYTHMGISSMNGITDGDETVTVGDFETILGYAQEAQLSRLTFWSVNRDRPCEGGGGDDTCSGVDQEPWEFTSVLARYVTEGR
ncbi:chitinase [Streptomyces triticagri]|uniref:chitinase n=1 Tax=Streptomyces triticagri TaxID=2293568 RepID=UPI002D798893|nr:chitinase [Streptomyces triticagri]